MPKIDVDSLWDRAGKLPGEHVQNFCRLIIEECEKTIKKKRMPNHAMGAHLCYNKACDECIEALREMKP